MTQTAKRSGAAPPAPKGPVVRLLDMLIGWAEFVGEASEAPDPALEEGALYDLYQEAAAQLMGLSEGKEAAAVEAFVRERVLPLLLGQGPAGPAR